MMSLKPYDDDIWTCYSLCYKYDGYDSYICPYKGMHYWLCMKIAMGCNKKEEIHKPLLSQNMRAQKQSYVSSSEMEYWK